jgi:hypothetical protein
MLILFAPFSLLYGVLKAEALTNHGSISSQKGKEGHKWDAD